MAHIGERLREERDRLGLTQDQLGVTPQAQRRYEKGERSPDAEYLAAFAAQGADILYVVTGKRTGDALEPEVQRLVSAFLVAGPTLRAAAFAVLATGSVPPGGAQLTFEGSVGAAVAGDATFNAPVTAKKARKK